MENEHNVVQYALNNGIARKPVTCDVIITAADAIITAHFLVSSPLYFFLLEVTEESIIDI